MGNQAFGSVGGTVELIEVTESGTYRSRDNKRSVFIRAGERISRGEAEDLGIIEAPVPVEISAGEVIAEELRKAGYLLTHSSDLEQLSETPAEETPVAEAKAEESPANKAEPKPSNKAG